MWRIPRNTDKWLDPEHATPDRLAKACVIDVRWPYERMISRPIDGALEWTPILFDRQLKQIPHNREAILVCETGMYSYTAGYRLASSGYPNVRVIFGGYSSWRSLQ